MDDTNQNNDGGQHDDAVDDEPLAGSVSAEAGSVPGAVVGNAVAGAPGALVGGLVGTGTAHDVDRSPDGKHRSDLDVEPSN